jgi:hypothetical protein|tara:strand:- start:298 stop:414 length:117 start_codon:yes stop_codon:yes gene_type:complete
MVDAYVLSAKSSKVDIGIYVFILDVSDLVHQKNDDILK